MKVGLKIEPILLPQEEEVFFDGHDDMIVRDRRIKSPPFVLGANVPYSLSDILLVVERIVMTQLVDLSVPTTRIAHRENSFGHEHEVWTRLDVN